MEWLFRGNGVAFFHGTGAKPVERFGMASRFPADAPGVVHDYQCKNGCQCKVSASYPGGHADGGGKGADCSTMGRGHPTASHQTFRQKIAGLDGGETKFQQLRKNPCGHRRHHTGIACGFL